QLITERGQGVSHETELHDDLTSGRGAVVHNTSSGVVGIQAAHVVNSNVWMNRTEPAPPPADLTAALASLRDELARERSVGALDEPTYRAAQTELDHAEKALAKAAEAHTWKSRFVLALKRLRGLVEDVTDLATKIASLIKTATDLT